MEVDLEVAGAVAATAVDERDAAAVGATADLTVPLALAAAIACAVPVAERGAADTSLAVDVTVMAGVVTERGAAVLTIMAWEAATMAAGVAGNSRQSSLALRVRAASGRGGGGSACRARYTARARAAETSGDV